MREVALDVDEGADIVMVKPALPYLDVIARVEGGVRPAGGRLLGVGRVRDDQGGRRSSAGSTRSARCWRRSPAIRRAGADIIITYFAKDAARLLEQGRA